VRVVEGRDAVRGARIGIVASRYNGYIVDRLLDGCVKALQDAGIAADAVTLARVPGAYEIPVAVQRMAGGGYDALIALGAVIRGETPHFDYICTECSRGLAEVALATRIPVIFGVLTVDTAQQALDRSGEAESNKGCEAAQTALEMIDLLRKLP